MIVRFALSEHALRSLATLIPAERAVAQTRLLNLWHRAGVLVTAQATGGDRLEDLDPCVRHRWQKLWTQGRSWFAGLPRLDSPTLRNCPACVQQFIDLACIEPDLFTELRVATVPDLAGRGARPELCDIRYVDVAECVREADGLREMPVQKGTSTETVWRQRFSKLASTCHTDVTIVDRYCLQACLPGSSDPNGLRALLTRLAGELPNRPVTVFSGFDERRTDSVAVVKAVKTLGRELAGSGLSALTFYYGADFVFKRHQHFRYVRFGRFLCLLDPGLELLAGDHVGRAGTIELKVSEPFLPGENFLRGKLSRCNAIPSS